MIGLKYDDSFPMKAAGYAREGAHDGEIAAKLGISRSMFYNYKHQYPEFAEALESGRALPELEVGNNLLNLAMGECVSATVVRNSEGREVRTVRHRSPDVRAMILWLEKNKQYGDDYVMPETVKVAEAELLPEPEQVWRPDPEEELKAKALAEYHALPGFRPDPDFSKKDKAEFDSLISITLAEVEKRKQQAAGIQPAAASAVPAPANAGDIPKGLPTMYAMPQNFSKMSNGRLSGVSCWPHGQNSPAQTDSKMSKMKKIEWSPEVIEAWKALAEDFERL